MSPSTPPPDGVFQPWFYTLDPLTGPVDDHRWSREARRHWNDERGGKGKKRCASYSSVSQCHRRFPEGNVFLPISAGRLRSISISQHSPLTAPRCLAHPSHPWIEKRSRRFANWADILGWLAFRVRVCALRVVSVRPGAPMGPQHSCCLGSVVVN